jgi:hypothetical protein
MTATAQRTACACALVVLVMAACVSAPKNPLPPPTAAPPALAPLEASYDWHGLLLVQFGSVLKEVPFTLHEVLLFRDAAHAAAGDEPECYAMEQTAPRLVARTPSEYMLCFKHDRLVRVQATVRLPQSDAVRILNDACGLWQHNAGALQAGALQGGAAQAATGPAVAEQTATAATAGDGQPAACDGRDGAISYSGRLDQEAEQDNASLTVTLDTAVQL